MTKKQRTGKPRRESATVEEALPSPDPPKLPPKRPGRGFAAMDPEKLREISSKGGYAVHAAGKAYEFSRGEEAAEAGRRGGLTTSSDPEHMAEIGRKGANAKHRKGRFFGLLGT